MDILNTQITQLQNKLQLLLKNYAVLQKENIHLKKNIEKKENLLQAKTQQIQDFQQQLDSLKITRGGWGEEDKKQLQRRIDQYLKEIDICLAGLNQ